MALINCPECGKEVSDTAPVCIHCGYVINKSQTKEVRNKSKELVSKIRDYISQTVEKSKKVPKKILIPVISVVLVCLLLIAIPSGVGKDKRDLKKCLLSPSSLTVYQAYTNNNYSDGGRATLFYFGAENTGGGISDDWALVYRGDVQFYSDFKYAESSGDNSGILDNSDVVQAKFAVSIGNEAWKEVRY